jgi:SpoIID/LytB domain protein
MVKWLRKVSLLLVVCLVSQMAYPGAIARAIAPENILVEGRGWGHGRGLQQWGALGYEIDHLWSYEQILQHYYSNTTSSYAADREIKVHITRNNEMDLLVTSLMPFSVEGIQFYGNQIVRISANGPHSFNIHQSSGCADPGYPVWSAHPGRLDSSGRTYVEVKPLSTDSAVNDLNQLLQLITCDRSNASSEVSRRHYRGSLGLIEQNGQYTFNRVLREQYLRGVVPQETPSSWGIMGGGTGMQALRAQAIAARTYLEAISRRRQAKGYMTDTCDTIGCQVYLGASANGQPLDYGPDFWTTTAAVTDTAGMIRVSHDGSIPLAEFGSSSGGWTAPQSELSAFPAVVDDGDDVAANPHHVWEKTIRRADVESMYPEIGQLKEIKVTLRNGLGEWGGRTRQLLFRGTSANTTVDISNWAEDSFRRGMSLKSDWYRFPQFPEYSDPGFWLAKSNGGVLAVGTAKHFGDAKEADRSGPIVDIAAPGGTEGYWLVSDAGEVFAYGNAVHHGDLRGQSLAEPVVAMTAHPTGNGYWLATADGGVFSFGNVGYHGSMGGIALNKPVVGMETTRSGNGYWLVASDGGIFSFGDAGFFGSTGDIVLNKPITSMTAARDGQGYWFVASDGGVFAFGSVEFFGSRGGDKNRRSTAGMAVTNTNDGYWLVWDDGTSFPFGDAPDFASSVAKRTVVAIEVVP